MTQIGFSTPSYFNPISWLVRKITKSRTSHAWFKYYDQDFEMDMVMEAHELGFRLIPFERFKKHNEVVAIWSTSQNLQEGLKWAATWLGSAYDFGGLLGMAKVILGRILSRRWRNPTQNSKAMFCSEMAVSVLQLSGVPWARDLVASEVSPQDLMELFERQAALGDEVQTHDTGQSR
ncbi:MAG: hypothetical protein E6R04_05095 [Spirochaetes bacterium]|nr:MAG: hypothetical protein E6R04_05095 [Spirochaetota bacterium]